MSWHLPGTNAIGQAVYQLDVHADGRYVADGDGPKDVNGYYQIKTTNGDAPNPLWQFDGNVDLLSHLEGIANAGPTSSPRRHEPHHRAGNRPARGAPRAGPASSPRHHDRRGRRRGRCRLRGHHAFGDNQVGTQYHKGIQVSDDQIINPIGNRLLTQFGKFMGSTVSPNGRFLAATSTDKSVVLQIFDLKTYKLIWTVGSASAINQKLSDGTVGQEGPTYSPDGKFLWLPEQDALTRFPVNHDGTLGTPARFALPTVGTHPSGNDATPTPNSALVGKTVYSPDGIDAVRGIERPELRRRDRPGDRRGRADLAVGIAPRHLAFVGGKLYVSNEGGRRAGGDTTMDSYGTKVPANGYLGTSTTGTVSVIDPPGPARVKSIAVGLHPTALYAQGTVAVRREHRQRHGLGHRHRARHGRPDDRAPGPGRLGFGYEPTGITLTGDNHLLVTLGRANAVAVYRYHDDPLDPVSYIGLLPTDYYPAAVATVGSKVVVTNPRGIDARGPA